jgi:hypothetical protein
MATVNTTWVSPASATLDKATGGTIDETMTDAWSSDLYHLGGTAGYIGCRASHLATQSIANTTNTVVALNAEAFDSDPNGAMHDVVTNNSRVVVRTAGTYHVSAYVQWAFNATGYRRLYLRVNGGAEMAAVMQAAMAGDPTDQTVYTAYALNASDYVEAVVAQSSGGALNLAVGATVTLVKA